MPLACIVRVSFARVAVY